jgi:hypothetical protein
MTLKDAQDAKTAEIKAQAQERIYAREPLWRQMNCALGFYDEERTAAIKQNINEVRQASDAAEATVRAMTDPDEVMAFTW